jgi:hypothetical protein
LHFQTALPYSKLTVFLQEKLQAVAAAGYTSFDTADIYGPSEGVCTQTSLLRSSEVFTANIYSFKQSLLKDDVLPVAALAPPLSRHPRPGMQPMIVTMFNTWSLLSTVNSPSLLHMIVTGG